MKKKNTLDKFMVTSLDIKNTKTKKITLPDGTEVGVPKLSYRHFVKIKTLKDPMDTLRYIIDEIKPRELTSAETEFVLIHLHYHNDKKASDSLAEIGINLDDMKISDPQYHFVFNNIEMTFRKPSLLSGDLGSLIEKAVVDGKEIELTDQKRIDLINCLYRYEHNDVMRGVLQEVYIVHEGKTIKGLNIIGE